MNSLVIASNTIGAAMRQRILNIVLILAIGFMILAFTFSYFSPTEEMTIVKSLGLFMIQIGGLFIAVVLGINLIPAEIEKRTIYTILSKPVQRYEFVLGKFLGGYITVFLNIALLGLAFLLIVALKRYNLGYAPLELPLLKGVVMIFFQMLIVTSVAIFFSVFVPPFVNFFLTAALFIVGNMSSLTESIMNNPNQTAVAKAFFSVVHFLLPNFGNFNIQNPLIHPTQVIRNEAQYIMTNVVYALVYASVLLVAAMLIFDRREV